MRGCDASRCGCFPTVRSRYPGKLAFPVMRVSSFWWAVYADRYEAPLGPVLLSLFFLFFFSNVKDYFRKRETPRQT